MTTQTVIGQQTGTIGVDGDSDWFKVSLTAGTQYVFDVTNGTLTNSHVSLYDSSGTLINSSVTGNPAGGAQIAFEPTASGTYFVGASAAGNAVGTYTVTESTAPFDFAGTTATTGTLAIGGSASGNLSVGGQSDWYKVTLTAGTGYNFSIASTTSAGLVTVYDSSGHRLVSGDDGNTISGTSVFYVPTTSGTYYIGASDTGLATGTFTLSAATAAYDFAGNTGTTGTVAVGGSVSGTIANTGQSDWFKVTLTAGTEYVFDVSGAITPTVSLYDASGNQLVTGFNGGPSGGARTSFEPTTSGTYYVAAGSLLSTTGAFTVAVSTATPDFANNVNTTGTVTVGGQTAGTIATVAQSDWFKVQLSAGTGYELSVGGGTLTGATVTLYDANGNSVAQGSGGNAFYEATSSGTYYVAAAGSNGSTGTFNVGVTTGAFDHAGNVNTDGTVAVGGNASGTISNLGQSDWFKVSLNAGTQYVFTVGGGTLTGAQVGLYSSSGNLVLSSSSGGITAFTPTTSDTYYVSASGTSTGSFTVSVATATDDYAGNTSTTGFLAQTYTVANALAAYNAKTLGTGSFITDSANNVQGGLAALKIMATAGDISKITLTDSSTPTITVTQSQLAADAGILKAITSPFTLAITGSSTAMSTFVQQENFAYTPGTSNAGSDQVVEISSVAAGASTIALGSGFNAVIIDGSHSTTASAAGQPDSFSFNVQANGTVTLLDNNTGHSQTITGDTYLIFNGAGTNTDATHSFQSVYFVTGSTEAQITSLYNAAFLRQPDLGGLEFYAKPIIAGSFDLHQAAVYFLASPEFAADYPTAAAPTDHGGPNDQAFITTLYNNVLHRSPSASEIGFYANALSSGSFDRASLMEFFSASPENQQNVSNLIVNTNNGSYADSSAQLPASTVLSQVSSSSALNLSAIATSSIGTGVSSNGISIAANDAVTLTSAAPAETVFMSSSFSTLTVQNSGSTIFDAAGGSAITLSGSSNTTLTLTNGVGFDVVNLTGGTGTTVNGFTAGSGTVLMVTAASLPSNLQILDGSVNQVSGSSLAFGGGTSYVVDVGTVADHTAATLAAAANKAYALTGAANEQITFIAQDASGNTTVWSWAGVGTATDHQVDAGELTSLATIVGVLPHSLAVTDLA